MVCPAFQARLVKKLSRMFQTQMFLSWRTLFSSIISSLQDSAIKSCCFSHPGTGSWVWRDLIFDTKLEHQEGITEERGQFCGSYHDKSWTVLQPNIDGPDGETSGLHSLAKISQVSGQVITVHPIVFQKFSQSTVENSQLRLTSKQWFLIVSTHRIPQRFCVGGT